MPRCLPVVLLLIVWLVPAARAQQGDDPIKADEALLGKAGLPTDGPGLVQFFRSRTPGETQLDGIEKMIKQLGDDSFKLRQKASEELVKVGPGALSSLRGVLGSNDPEVVSRAQQCIAAIEQSIRPDMMAAAIRLLAQRKPPGAAAALVAHIPFVTEEHVLDELGRTLAVVGFSGGKADETLLRALEDRRPVRRAVAAEAIIRGGSEAERARARKLLTDSEPRVRLRVALALVERKDRGGIEPLINLLTDLSRDELWRIENVLYSLAGDNAPKATAGETEADRRDYQAAWKKWWREQGEQVKLDAVEPARRLLGLTLVVEAGLARAGRGRIGSGRVFEVGMDGQVRWEIKDLNYPIAAQVVGNDRVLIAEQRGQQLSERNFKGEVLWQKQLEGMVSDAQRLDNGNTLVVMRDRVVELNKAGEEVFSYQGERTLIIAARRLKNGETMVIERNGGGVRLDARGKELKRFTIENVPTFIFTHMDVLPNGNLLLPMYTHNKIIEVSPDGKVVREIATESPTAVQRLPNGNLLVASRLNRVVREISRDGTSIWQYQSPNGYILHAQRR